MDYYLSGEIRAGSAQGDIVAKVSTVVTITAIQPNAPPQYIGPTIINDLVVGQARALQGFDADGDAIAWSVDPGDAAKVSVTPGGALTPLIPLAGVAVTIWLDDGKP